MITIRPATASDSRDLFDWRNDEGTRSVSGSRDAIGWPDHQAWFARALAAQDRTIYIAEGSLDEVGSNDGDLTSDKLGMCRFDIETVDGSRRAEVSINLNPVARGRGLAARILDGAITAFLAESTDFIRLTATIRPANTASARVFEKAGFLRVDGDSDFDYYELPV
ncbi:GNAT family N-acetyltransferase [Leifsonia poae]|uniref:GNAT family N-acetyltransferase n=1 Tax=Leifsonia poae TaxID=110933 RepID=UPI001CBB2DC0|nr:GNAT family protein [Leifsonia poae]